MITIKQDAYTFLPGERQYGRSTDLPLDISTLEITGMCDDDFWRFCDVYDTSGNLHRMKSAAVNNSHLIGADLNPETLASTLIWIKVD